GEWVQLSNTSYLIPEGAKNLVLYVETDDGTNSFFVDDIVGALDGVEVEGAGKPEPTTEPEPEPIVVTPGDVNDDGEIDIFDLALAKRGVVNGFADEKQEKAADMDESGKAEVADLIALTKRIHGIQ
ncbi:MAG: dockerin type I repeat-containing protein, partial [Oscillospiraceae bacterium]|nr:dockerin type I repeat-containing protein [Oscillospiraceae bacterium]